MTAAALLVTFNFFQNRQASEREREALDRTINDAVGDRFAEQQRSVRDSMGRVETSLGAEIERVDRKVDLNRQLELTDWNGHEDRLNNWDRRERIASDQATRNISDLKYQMVSEGALSGSLADIAAQRALVSMTGIGSASGPFELGLSLGRLRDALSNGHNLEPTLDYRLAEQINPIPTIHDSLWNDIWHMVDEQRSKAGGLQQ